SDTLAGAKAEGRSALIAYLPAGFPTVDGGIAVMLVVSELVTNVVRHARGRLCSLDLSDVGHGVGISVSDDDPEPPRPRRLDLTGQGGLGWPLVSRLSSELTVHSRPDGKTVRAVVLF
ncbi:ATP-binding protein, partial [Streptomyces aureus]